MTAPDLFSAVPDSAQALRGRSASGAAVPQEPREPPRLGRACMICEAGNAPFGLGMPGFRSEIKPGERGMLWHCGGEACAAKAEARRSIKLGGRHGA